MWDPVQLKDCDALTSEVDYIVSVKDNSVQNGLNPRLDTCMIRSHTSCVANKMVSRWRLKLVSFAHITWALQEF